MLENPPLLSDALADEIRTIVGALHLLLGPKK